MKELIAPVKAPGCTYAYAYEPTDNNPHAKEVLVVAKDVDLNTVRFRIDEQLLSIMGELQDTSDPELIRVMTEYFVSRKTRSDERNYPDQDKSFRQEDWGNRLHSYTKSIESFFQTHGSKLMRALDASGVTDRQKRMSRLSKLYTIKHHLLGGFWFDVYEQGIIALGSCDRFSYKILVAPFLPEGYDEKIGVCLEDPSCTCIDSGDSKFFQDRLGYGFLSTDDRADKRANMLKRDKLPKRREISVHGQEMPVLLETHNNYSKPFAIKKDTVSQHIVRHVHQDMVDSMPELQDTSDTALITMATEFYAAYKQKHGRKLDSTFFSGHATTLLRALDAQGIVSRHDRLHRLMELAWQLGLGLGLVEVFDEGLVSAFTADVKVGVDVLPFIADNRNEKIGAFTQENYGSNSNIRYWGDDVRFAIGDISKQFGRKSM